jgi:hypothetical protein
VGIREWGRCRASARLGKAGRVPAWKPTWGCEGGQNVRLEFMEKLRLSVEAMGRSEENMSARLKAGMGDAKDCVGADARELAEDLRVTSGHCALAIMLK